MRRKDVILRAAGMLGALCILVVGATFALNEFQSNLTNVTFSSATENLKVATGSCSTFSQTNNTSLAINNLTEGADYVSGNAKVFCLKNVDTVNLAVTVMADLSSVVSTGTIDHSKVGVRIIDTSNSNLATDTTLQALESGPVAINGLDGSSRLAANGGTDNFTINFKLNPGAVSGSSASLTGFTLTFTGTEF